MLAPLGQTTAMIQVQVDDKLDTHLPLNITVRLTTPGGCQETMETVLRADINGDVLPESSNIEDVDTPATVRTAGGTEPAGVVWSRTATPTGRFLARRRHRSRQRHLARVTADGRVREGAAGHLVDHAYSFEFSDRIDPDGGMFELTLDGGKNWQDIADFTAQTGYGGAINSAANPRQAQGLRRQEPVLDLISIPRSSTSAWPSPARRSSSATASAPTRRPAPRAGHRQYRRRRYRQRALLDLDPRPDGLRR